MRDRRGPRARRRWDDQAREIDFRDQVRVADEAGGRPGEAVGEESRRQAADQDGYFSPSGDLGDLRRTEHSSGGQGLEDRPCDAEHRLFVAHLDVTPDEEVEELAELPKLAEAEDWRAPALGSITITGGGASARAVPVIACIPQRAALLVARRGQGVTYIIGRISSSKA